MRESRRQEEKEKEKNRISKDWNKEIYVSFRE